MQKDYQNFSFNYQNLFFFQVLREAKALLSELISGDLDQDFNVNTESLKLPIMPSNVNVLIDVLKDVLYVLETNTNSALLALLIHCFSASLSPADVLKKHFKATGNCPCHVRGDDEDCCFVTEFDLYNERLLQIGNFAVSCSSDQNSEHFNVLKWIKVG